MVPVWKDTLNNSVIPGAMLNFNIAEIPLQPLDLWYEEKVALRRMIFLVSV